MDLAALVPAESPASVAGFATATEAPQTEEMTVAATMGLEGPPKSRAVLD